MAWDHPLPSLLTSSGAPYQGRLADWFYSYVSS
jgi:hypothetical protein